MGYYSLLQFLILTKIILTFRQSLLNSQFIKPSKRPEKSQHKKAQINKFGHKDLYVNIAITENIDIHRTQLLEYNHPEITTQICRHLETILQQNYYIFREQIYQHNKGIAMGSHISGTMAEIFLQHLEPNHIRPLMDSRKNTVLHPLHR